MHKWIPAVMVPLVTLAWCGPADAAPRRDVAVKRNAVGTAQIKDGSVRLRDIRAGEVTSGAKGRAMAVDIFRLQQEGGEVRLRVDGLDGAIGAVSNVVRDLTGRLTGLRGDVYTRAESDAVFARRDAVVSGRGSVVTGVATPSDASVELADIPGLGRLEVSRGANANATTFRFINTSGGDVSVASPTDAQVIANGDDYVIVIDRRAATLQLLGGSPAKPALATMTVSEAIIGKDGIIGEDTLRASAQILIAL